MGVAGGRMAVAGEGRKVEPNGTWRLGHLLKGKSPWEMGPTIAGPARREVWQTAGRRSQGLVMLFVHRFADVVSGESSEDQRLDRAGEQT